MNFGEARFGGTPTKAPQDSFAVVTGEVLQRLATEHMDRRFLMDESISAVAAGIHSPRSSSQAKQDAVLPYVGVWLVVRFPLGDHVSRFGMEIVTPAPVEDTPIRLGLTCIFDTEPWSEQLASLAMDTEITVMGQIEQIGAFAIRLRNCELVK